MRRDHGDRAEHFLREFLPMHGPATAPLGFYATALARKLLADALKRAFDDCADAALERVARARRERRR